ncbi:formylglycine-generating enzyme family protein [Magnetococcus sp. PR-3]|uniref:formylglycine-generating enzyme family protein n=1 Tax=Magnetococcus sp. PR-3 TaxID=3120355 RepID=UPI002FCE2593
MKDLLTNIFKLQAKRAFKNPAQIHFSLVGPLLKSLGWATENPMEVECVHPQTDGSGNPFPGFLLKLENQTSCTVEVHPQGSVDKNIRPTLDPQAPFHMLTDGRIWRCFYRAEGAAEPAQFKAFELKPESVGDAMNLLQGVFQRDAQSTGAAAQKLNKNRQSQTNKKLDALRGLIPKAEAICDKPPHPKMDQAMIHLIKKAGWTGISRAELDQVLQEYSPPPPPEPSFDDDPIFGMGSSKAEGNEAVPAQAATLVRQENWIEPVTGMEFIWVPGGEFIMGSPDSEPGRQKDEGPTHQVTLDGFWLSKFPLTLPQWQMVMEGGPRMAGTPASPGDKEKPPQLPADTIVYEELQTFMDKLVMLGGGGSRLRIPTEAEWEFACRAGTQWRCFFDPKDKKQRLEDYTWMVTNSGGEIQPVGTKKPNPWGFHDMLGLVWEWVSDHYSLYSSTAVTNPTGPANPTREGIHVRRGGSFRSNAKACRSARRNQAKVDALELQNSGGVGIRFARFIPKDEEDS